MSTATLTTKGQVTLPAEVRRALGVAEGDKLSFTPLPDGGFRVAPANRDAASLKGLVPKPKKPVSLEDMEAAIRRRGQKA